MFACSRRISLGVALLAFAITGCGPSKVKISGKLLKSGQPMVVSEDTYVTLSFIPENKSAETGATSYSAKFDQKSGSYTVELPSGKYRTLLVIALPGQNKSKGKVNVGPSVKSEQVHELTKSKQLDIEVP
jgi:hypothetical protein